MKATLTLDGAPVSIEISENGAGCVFRIGGAAPREALVAAPEPGVYSILLDGRTYEARVENGQVVVVNGRRFAFERTDPRRWNRGAAAGGGHGEVNLCAPMPGKVVRLLAAEGEEVEAGQGIVVVEAMKMQNEVKSPRAGKVESVRVQPGEAVAPGQILAVVG